MSMLGDHDIDVPDPRRTPVMKPDTFWLQNKSQIWKLLSKFEDPYGVIARKNVKVRVWVCVQQLWCVTVAERSRLVCTHQGMFRECSCHDNWGEERVCIPPRPGYLCERYCRVIKVTPQVLGGLLVLSPGPTNAVPMRSPTLCQRPRLEYESASDETNE